MGAMKAGSWILQFGLILGLVFVVEHSTRVGLVLGYILMAAFVSAALARWNEKRLRNPV
jgi:hypothetical protein